MVYIAVGLMLAIMYGIEWLDTKRLERSTMATEETQQKMYNLIDEYFGDSPAQARERKAEVDMIIAEHWNELNREYKPSTKQVTTAGERKERNKACREGRYSEYKIAQLKRAQALDAIDEVAVDMLTAYDIAREKIVGKDYTVSNLVNELGVSHEEATASVNRFIETMCY